MPLRTFVLATVLGFLITTPYSLVDTAYFVEQVMFEAAHYQSGHRGAEGEPGLEQLAYYLGRTAAEFGIGHRFVDTHEMESADYRANRPDRCYHC